MNKEQNIYLLGMSGHALSVIDALRSHGMEPLGYLDRVVDQKTSIEYLGIETDENFSERLVENAILFPAVGSNRLRKKMVAIIEKVNLQQMIVAHASAIISKTVQIEKSTFISAGAIINTLSTIGKGVIVNTGAIVEHECSVADFVHLGPGSVLAGNCSIGEMAFIGANSTIIQGVTIGKNVIIGAGSVVLKDVPDNTVYVGNPAKYLKNNE